MCLPTGGGLGEVHTDTEELRSTNGVTSDFKRNGLRRGARGGEVRTKGREMQLQILGIWSSVSWRWDLPLLI